MHHLVLVRHAQAIPETLSGNDRQRPLTAQGEADAKALATRLAAPEHHLVSPHIWHSSALRTTLTARSLAEAFTPRAPCMSVDALYDLDLYGILELIRETSETIRTLIIVGHNPALAEACCHLTSDATDAPLFRELMHGFAPGSAGLFHVTSDWMGLSPNTASLRDVLHP